MTPDPTQPQPQAEGDNWRAETDASILKQYGVTLPAPDDPQFAEKVGSFNLHGNPSYWFAAAVIRATLRRAAWVVRDRIETHPDGWHKETIVDAAVNRALDAAADAIEAAAK